MVFKTGATAPVPPPVKLGSLPATANGGGDLTAQMLQQKIEDGATEVRHAVLCFVCRTEQFVKARERWPLLLFIFSLQIEGLLYGLPPIVRSARGITRHY